jgi:CBS domain-containing protein
MQVSEIMHKGVSTVQINDPIKKVAALMKREDIGAVPVYKNERPVGFVTDRDIVISCLAQGYGAEESISHAMSREIFSVYEDDDLNIATQMMREHQVSRLLVVDKGDQPVGMLSIHDIAEHMDDQDMITNTISAIKRS